MRWLRPLGLIQLLCVLAMALPSVPPPSLEETNALAIRAPGDLEIPDDAHGISSEHSLQIRASESSGGVMAMWQSAAQYGIAGGILLRYNTAGGAALLSASIPLFVLGQYYGIKNTVHDNKLIARRQDLAEKKLKNDEEEEDQRTHNLKIQSIRQRQDYKQLEIEANEKDIKLAEQKLEKGALAVKKKELELKNQELQNKKTELKRQLMKWKQEDNDRAKNLKDYATQAKRDATNFKLSVEKQTEDLNKARRDNKKALEEEDEKQQKKGNKQILAKIQTRLDTLKKIVDAESENEKLADELIERLDKVEKEEDAEKQGKAISKAHQDYADIISKMETNQKEYEDIAGESTDEEEVSDETVEEIEKRIQLTTPGAFPNRRRFRSDSNVPQLIHETNTDCEDRWCHRIWYTVEQPETEKRDLGGDDDDGHPIYDFSFTPPHYEFQRDGVLERRAPPGNTTTDNEEIHDDECVYTEDDDNGKKIEIHVRVLAQFGGDFESLQAASFLGKAAFMRLWLEDVKSLPTVKDKDSNQEYSQFWAGGIGCWKFDLDGGKPAIWLAKTLADDTRYSSKSAKSILDQCKALFKKNV
ncbi:hypothetical protein N7492_000623 [Penicillium capsulatum]|uniref:Uncharacterized protein n=1 Tax=Penicillium capsulatum TaxID=69766 RepID=A0A9W9M0A1_9EURO|nr:hypothetical protein N7492_000623 [Penicillium capsulatum]KAJ6130319.1 hypothetical protein N7512_003099 [Penicillium capsulatum]